MALSIEAYLAQQDAAEAWHEAMIEWAVAEGLDPDDDDATAVAFEQDVEDRYDAYLEAKAEAFADARYDS